MSGIRDIASSTAVPDDLAERLGPSGVNEILRVLWQGYHDLLDDTDISISRTAREDDITQEWYGKVSVRWASENRAVALYQHILPVHQYRDAVMGKKRGSSPAIDFCFRDWDSANSYFGVECKNLYEGRQDRIERYVSTGVEHYVSGRYGSQSSESAMAGYVLTGKIQEIVGRLIPEINRIGPVSGLSRETRRQ